MSLAAAILFLFRNLFAADPLGEDWPRFLGPRADNTSTETGLLDQWPATGPPLVWEKAVGTGYSAPSLRGQQAAWEGLEINLP